MEDKIFNRIDGLTHQSLLDDMVAKAYIVAVDTLKEEPFEVEDVLNYLSTVIHKRVGNQLEVDYTNGDLNQ